MSNLFFELGSEELPLSSLDLIYGELSEKTAKVLNHYRIPYAEIHCEATPRRIALFIGGIEKRQSDRTVEWSGPSAEKAYDTAGNPTPALLGFVKSKKAALSDVKIKETEKGKFVLIIQKETGKALSALLPDITKEIFSSLSFTKQMRWESTGFRFPRPIRWLVVLLDHKVVPLHFCGITAKALSFGHRFLSPKSFPIKKADWPEYEKTLKSRHVILNLKKREAVIREALSRKYSQKKIDEDLVRLNAQLVEDPFLIQGHFSKTYLDLPAEVLASCMKKNQKIFICYDAKGEVSGRFVAVLNGKRTGLKKIQEDFENVLESRLKDAQFFYREDTKTSLEEKVARLNQIVYLGKLGTLQDKTERLVKLSGHFASLSAHPEFKENLQRAAKLSKADLTTQLVYEFTDLQGVVGREYAYASGENKEVAEAIGTQYLPKNLSEETSEVKKNIPLLGAALGVVDRWDLLVGAFSIGLEPTGSQDPFALRRAGGILVKLVRAYGFRFSLNQMAREAMDLFHGLEIKGSKEEVVKRLKAFLKERIIFELKVQAGTREFEILQAVLKSDFDDLADVFARYEILTQSFQSKPQQFLKTAKVIERTSNILKGIQGKIPEEIRPDLLKESLEKELYKVIQSKSGEIQSAIRDRDYHRATCVFGDAFHSPVHDFFEKVLVNAEDKEIRSNRQALMKKIYSLYADRVADLSVLSRIDLE